MKEKQYIQCLEDKLASLVIMLTDANLFNFLSDSEREKVADVIKASTEAKLKYSN